MIASLLSLPVVLRAAPRATAPSMVAGATSAAPFDKDAFNSVVQTTYGRFDFVVARGRGCYLWNAEGERYLDFAAGISTCCLGHANENLALAVKFRKGKKEVISRAMKAIDERLRVVLAS